VGEAKAGAASCAAGGKAVAPNEKLETMIDELNLEATL